MNIYLDLYLAFVKIGLLSFGGGYSMIPLIEREIIGKGWLAPAEFIDIVAIAEMTPGTVAANLATYTGFNIAGIPGALIATLGVITPSLVILIFLGSVLWKIKCSAHGEAVLKGIRPAFICLMILAAVFMARHAMTDPKSILIGVLIFGLMVVKKISPFLVIALGGVLGLLLY